MKIYKNTVFFEKIEKFKIKKDLISNKKNFYLNKKFLLIKHLYSDNKIIIFNNINIIFQKNLNTLSSKNFILIRYLSFFLLKKFKYCFFILFKNLLKLKFLKPTKISKNNGLPKNFFYFENYCHKNLFYSNYAYNKKKLIPDQKSFVHTKYNQQIILNFLENFFKKKFFLKNSSNYIKCIEDYQLKYFILSNRNTGYSLSKYFNIKEFIEIIWYSFYFRDLNMLSVWVSKTMEKMSFRNHKKFVMFFQNFFLKNSTVFLSILCINGFFFDIRGKVGVTGSSKKRHISFKIGILNRSSKKHKIEVNQKLVRTYAGVLGLTYIMSY